MRLGRNLLLLFYTAGLGASLAALAVVYLVLMPSFQELEDKSMRKDVARVEHAFMQMLTTLHARARDWASRPEVEELVKTGQRPGKFWLPESASGAMRLDQVMVFSEQGARLSLRHPGEESGTMGELYQAFRERICHPFSGVRMLEERPAMFVMKEVGNCGAVLFSVPLDDAVAEELSGVTGLEVHLGPPPEEVGEADIDVKPVSADRVAGLFVIRDYEGAPVASGRIVQPREVYREGIRALYWLGGLLALVALGSALVVHFLTRLLVFRRLARLHDTVRQVGGTRDLSLRVRPEGSDELAELGRDFNRMIESMADMHAELEQARQDAEEANRAKSRFLANMSHEIRTPMTAILGYTELLREAELGAGERRRYLDVIEHNGDALLVLLNEILDFSRLEAGRATLEKSDFSLSELLDDVISSHIPSAERKGVALRLLYSTPVPGRIESDPWRLRQMFMNLVGNAIKFTDQGSVTVEVEWREDLDRPLCVHVCDTGPGIPEDERERIFEPFWQVDGTDSRPHEGSGLGLAIVHQLARSLDGRVRLHSTSGRGSCFTLEVPARSLARALSTPEVRAPADTTGQQPQLSGLALVVEDNMVNRAFVRRVLEHAGMQVEEARDGRQALAWMEERQAPDLVVLDMQMPGMDGLETVDRLRKLGYSGPVLALTANVMQQTRERFLEAGCNAFLAKPVRVGELLRACRDLLGNASSGGNGAGP